jgi:hypothetical protein
VMLFVSFPRRCPVLRRIRYRDTNTDKNMMFPTNHGCCRRFTTTTMQWFEDRASSWKRNRT